MNTPDWTAIERMRDANAYSDALNEAESFEREQAYQDKQLRIAGVAIRRMDLTPETVRGLLAIIGCRMKACGFSESDVEAVETSGEVLS
jgi:hypothetical protein